MADDVLLPLTGTTLRSAIAVAASVSGVELAGSGLAFSAIKESEEGDWLVLRSVNLLDTEVRGTWRLPFDVAEAKLARLDETVIGNLEAAGREVVFRAGPYALNTILVR